MTNREIYKMYNSSEYNFMRNKSCLKDNTILVTLGGSHAYGTNVEGSDLDIRGIALNSKEEILLGRDFEQYTDKNTDTTIYSFNKIIKLLMNCNPNVIEMLGCKPEHYLVLSEIGKELKDNAHMFLSKRAFNSFGGYATAQLRRLDNKSARLVGQKEREQHVLNSINNARYSFIERYATCSEDNLKLYLDTSDKEGYDSEIFMDVNLHHYPLRDCNGMLSEINTVLRDYEKVGKRNQNAITKNKLGKHMMHLVRLYMMGLNILENEEIITFREKEHDLLMDIRKGKYLRYNQPRTEFLEMVDEFERKLEYAKKNTNLPDAPDIYKINEFVKSVNEKIIKEGIN